MFQRYLLSLILPHVNSDYYEKLKAKEEYIYRMDKIDIDVWVNIYKAPILSTTVLSDTAIGLKVRCRNRCGPKVACLVTSRAALVSSSSPPSSP